MSEIPGDLKSIKNRETHICLTFLKELFSDYSPRDFSVRLWDGTTWYPEQGRPARFTLVIRHPGALRRMFLPPSELSLGQAYIYNDYDIEGDIEAVFPVAEHLKNREWKIAEIIKLVSKLLKLPSAKHQQNGRKPVKLKGLKHSIKRDRQAVSYHYDVSNEFFEIWLDSNLVYSCAYFKSRDDDLDRAQEQKLDYICRKLRLKPKERLLDIGCGWGGLIIHAAKYYGVNAIGITLSQKQAELANERIIREGFSDRCRVYLCDYRELNEQESYDKIASVGMFEHVGGKMLPTYFIRARNLLKPGGVFLNHGISCNSSKKTKPSSSFRERYVFPDGELVPISKTLKIAEEVGFEVRDVESLREHYVLTLRHWRQRLEEKYDEAKKMTDEATYRTWRLFMSASAYGFEKGNLNVYQSLLVKSGRGPSGLPLTRDDWYGKTSTEAEDFRERPSLKART